MRVGPFYSDWIFFRRWRFISFQGELEYHLWDILILNIFTNFIIDFIEMSMMKKNVNAGSADGKGTSKIK
jgi:hypothetical protein